MTSQQRRTRIKFCGLTLEQDVESAINVGVDALGFVFYEKSPRYVSVSRAKALLKLIPPFVSTVGLFVNADDNFIEEVLDQLPLSTLQFHGDENSERCKEVAQRYQRTWLRAARVTSSLNLVEFAQQYHNANGLLLDAFVEGYGGGGHQFDWSLIPNTWLTQELRFKESVPPLVLSGGLTVHNVTEAIQRISPFAVDISSGIEKAKGIKDHRLMQQFVEAVHQADRSV